MNMILTGSDVEAELRVILGCRSQFTLSANGRSRTISYAAVPSARNVRWLLPLVNRRCTRKALSIYTPFALRARFLKAGLSLMTNFTSLWPATNDHLAFNALEYLLPLERLTQEHTGIHHPVFCFAIGTAGKYRKLGGQVMDLQGNVGGFIKISLTDEARQRVQHEAEILQELEAASVLPGQVPRVLYAGNWSNKFLLLTTAAPVKRSPSRLKPSHQEFLQQLHAYQARTVDAQSVCCEVEERWEREQHPRKADLAATVSRALQCARLRLGSARMRCGFAHGDFTPWNLRACGSEGQSLFAFDWEAARPGVLCGWDLFHFQVQCEGLLGKRMLDSTKLNTLESASLLLFLVNSICESIEEDLDGTSEYDLRYKSEILVREMKRVEDAA
jgi:hypothetical protein